MNSLENIKKAISLQKELDSLRPLSAEQNQKVLQKFRLDWNYHSNNIEGNSLTYGETKLLLLHGLTAQGKPLKDHLEIKGHNEAIDVVYDFVKDKEGITEYFIRSLNGMFIGTEPTQKRAIDSNGNETTRTIQGGRYKIQPNHVRTITRETFYFTSPEKTTDEVQELIKWYETEKLKTQRNPIILAAEFHYKFIRIHPFDDGNGRTARLLMNLILMRFDFPPAIIKTSDKENYYNVLRQADAGNITPFIDYIAQNIIYSLEIMISAAKGEDISDPNDLDKEITLLEQQLKTATSEIEVLRSKEAIENIYNNSLKRFREVLNKESKKFERFYLESNSVLWVQGSKVENDYLIDKEINRCEIIYEYRYFKYDNMNHDYYDVSFETKFESTHYFFFSKKTKQGFQKRYNSQLTDQEIKTLVEAETNLHKELIAQKIKEYQDKQL
ncbi:Fic family protein [Bernardetia sp. OM2101]|uniref:Fic family protein n=1 Tax=Bernardetia sp. OM2101 TaxID=3344876 RepID=UPI0035D0194F